MKQFGNNWNLLHCYCTVIYSHVSSILNNMPAPVVYTGSQRVNPSALTVCSRRLVPKTIQLWPIRFILTEGLWPGAWHIFPRCGWRKRRRNCFGTTLKPMKRFAHNRLPSCCKGSVTYILVFSLQTIWISIIYLSVYLSIYLYIYIYINK